MLSSVRRPRRLASWREAIVPVATIGKDMGSRWDVSCELCGEVASFISGMVRVKEHFVCPFCRTEMPGPAVRAERGQEPFPKATVPRLPRFARRYFR
jgi:hypothetical protein